MRAIVVWCATHLHTANRWASYTLCIYRARGWLRLSISFTLHTCNKRAAGTQIPPFKLALGARIITQHAHAHLLQSSSNLIASFHTRTARGSRNFFARPIRCAREMLMKQLLLLVASHFLELLRVLWRVCYDTEHESLADICLFTHILNNNLYARDRAHCVVIASIQVYARRRCQ